MEHSQSPPSHAANAPAGHLPPEVEVTRAELSPPAPSMAAPSGTLTPLPPPTTTISTPMTTSPAPSTFASRPGTPPPPSTSDVTESQDLIDAEGETEPTTRVPTPLPAPEGLAGLEAVIERERDIPKEKPRSRRQDRPSLPPPPSTTSTALGSAAAPPTTASTTMTAPPPTTGTSLLLSDSDAEDAAMDQSRMEVDPDDAEASATCLWGECGRLFTDLKSLIDHIHNDHVGVHKSNYTCEWQTCTRKGLAQTSRFALISHIRSHTGEKPFLCELAECDKAFTRSDALAKHMRLQHNMEPPPPGRGGNRKRKRGQAQLDEGTSTPGGSVAGSVAIGMSRAATGTTIGPDGGSISVSVMGTPGGAGDGKGGVGGFTTFKVEPGTYMDASGGGRMGQMHLGVNGYPSAAGHHGGVGNGFGLLGPRSMSPPVPPVPPALRHSASRDRLDEMEDPPASYFNNPSNLPAHLRPYYDPTTHTVHGRRLSMVLYLCMKAKHEYAMKERMRLEEELREVRMILEKERAEKEGILDELLVGMFGRQAEIVVGEVPPPRIGGMVGGIGGGEGEMEHAGLLAPPPHPVGFVPNGVRA